MKNDNPAYSVENHLESSRPISEAEWSSETGNESGISTEFELGLKLFDAFPSVRFHEGNKSDFQKLIHLISNQDHSIPLHFVMGLGASESMISPRIYCVLDHFAKIAEFAVKNGARNVSCKIFVASSLGRAINKLDATKVDRTTLRLLEFLTGYIDSFHHLLKPYFQAHTDNHLPFVKMLEAEIKEVASSLPTTAALERMSKGRSSIDDAKCYAASHAIQLRACEQNTVETAPFVVIPGGASESNFIKPISIASELFEKEFGYRKNQRIHCVSGHCTIPAYYPEKREPTLGQHIDSSTFEYAMWNSHRVRDDYLWLNNHPMKAYFINHFNHFCEA